MFDNLRDDANSFDNQDKKIQPATTTTSGPITRKSSRFLGMSSLQRFVIAFLLMLSVCVIGAMCLLATGKIGF